MRLQSTSSPRLCSVDGCDNPSKARGMCATHDLRVRTRGTTDAPPRRADVPVTRFREGASYQEIPLTQGKVALVDTEDYERISRFTWHYYGAGKNASAGHEGYARRNRLASESGPCLITMHHEILQPPPGMEVDHRRVGSGLDNRRENLRIVTHAENQRNIPMRRSNKSGYRGVHWDKRYGKWAAQITHMAQHYWLGYHDTPEAAYATYEAARERMGLIKPDGE